MKDSLPSQPRVVDETGLAVVHAGELISATRESAATISAAESNIVNYYFPVEIEIVGPGTHEALADTIYDALQREFNALV